MRHRADHRRFDPLQPPRRELGLPGVRAWMLLAILVAGCAARARPRCSQPDLLDRPRLTRSGIDLFEGAPLEAVQALPLVPTAPMRIGHGASRELLAELRQAVARGDCRFASQLVDQMRVDDADREYAHYALAWCRHDHGERAAAYAGLAELSRLGGDPGLRGFVINDLIAMLARAAPVSDALAVLRDARLAQPAYLDRYLAALVVARREQEAGALWSSTDPETPLADEAYCRRTVADCRRDLALGRWQFAYWTCGASRRPRASPACSAALALARTQTLIDWDGTRGPEAEVRAAVVSARGQRAAAGHGDDLDLILLVLRWDIARREPDHWRALEADAAALARSATSVQARSAAAELTRRAGKNASDLYRFAACHR